MSVPLSALGLLFASSTTGCSSAKASAASATTDPAIHLPLPPKSSTTQPTAPGNYVLDGYSSKPATATAQSEALAFRDKVTSAVKRNRFDTPAALTAAGYKSIPTEPEHWVNMKFVADGKLFDPDRPEFFVVTNGEVMGAMFLAPMLGYDVPEPPGAPFVRWHRHLWRVNVCLIDNLVVAREAVNGKCPAGQTPSRISPGMFHVWLGDVANPFTADMAAHTQH